MREPDDIRASRMQPVNLPNGATCKPRPVLYNASVQDLPPPSQDRTGKESLP